MAEKLYYTIGEVAVMFDVNPSLIRFWEKEFELLHSHKNKKGNRLFTQQDIDRIHQIYHLVKEKGYTLPGAKEKLKKDKQEIDRDIEILKTLKNVRQFLDDLKEQL